MPRRRPGHLTAAVTAAALTFGGLATAGGAFAAPALTVLAGTLSSGATYEARVPSSWNGTLVVFAHGYRGPGANPAWDARMDPTFELLYAEGYAVAASSYSTTGWAFATAVQDQLETVKRFGSDYRAPTRTIAIGRSMGGLVTSLMAEVPASGIDGAVSTCGIVAGGVALNNYQLDAAHAAAELLVRDSDMRLTGFTSRADATPTADEISAALTEAQQTPEGRARIALIAALLNVPSDLDGVDHSDPVAMEAAQFPMVLATLPEVLKRRGDIVLAAGGDSGWTEGVDYNQLLMVSPQAKRVRALYKLAGADLKADLRLLTAKADIEPDADALAWMERTSQPTGELQVPVLSTHTNVDPLVPVEMQEEYVETVRRAGSAGLFRQAYVDRVGHCTFTPAENVAMIHAMESRLDTGRWGNVASTRWLQADADALADPAGAAFYPWKAPEFVNDRVW